jgi:hypothetical protein
MVERNGNEEQYLRIIGRLLPSNRSSVERSSLTSSEWILELMPGYLTSNSQGFQGDPNSFLSAELSPAVPISEISSNVESDWKDRLRYKLWAHPYCANGKRLPDLAVRGNIPFPSTTRIVKFYWKNNPIPIPFYWKGNPIVMNELKVSEEKPQIEITWHVEPNSVVVGKHTITWKKIHPPDQHLQYFLRYSHDKGNNIWQRVGWRTAELGQDIDFDQLPGGESCKVAVVATDGVNTAIAETESFKVPIKPCISMILSPVEGDQFAPDKPLLLRGQGFDMENNTAETEALFWTSSIDGELGKGMLVEVPRLSIGSHSITLTAGTGTRAGKATIPIQVIGPWLSFWMRIFLIVIIIAIILSIWLYTRPLHLSSRSL